MRKKFSHIHAIDKYFMNYKNNLIFFCFEENDEKKHQTINFYFERILNIYINSIKVVDRYQKFYDFLEYKTISKLMKSYIK
jgi:hypothetical protein